MGDHGQGIAAGQRQGRATAEQPGADLLQYAGAALGIAGWFWVRQVGSAGAQQLGFLIWIAGGLALVVWGHLTGSRGILLINGVNTVMAASAFLALT